MNQSLSIVANMSRFTLIWLSFVCLVALLKHLQIKSIMHIGSRVSYTSKWHRIFINMIIFGSELWSRYPVTMMIYEYFTELFYWTWSIMIIRTLSSQNVWNKIILKYAFLETESNGVRGVALGPKWAPKEWRVRVSPLRDSSGLQTRKRP